MFVSLRRLALALAGALLLAGSSAAAAPKKPDVDEAQKMYEHASKSFRKKYYDEAIAEFEKLKNTFPFSKYAVEADLKIADALFAKREYGDAADDYRSFSKLHPKHELVDYATYRVGLSLFLEAPKAVDRDQASLEKAMEELRAFIQQFPDSKYAEDASKKIGEGRERLASKELYVGRYYAKHGKWKSSIGRLQNVVDHYPDADAAVEAQFLLGEAQWKNHQNDAAKATLTDFVEKHPDVKWSRDARKILARMGAAVAKPAPSPKTSPSPSPSPSATPAASPSASPTASP